MLSFLKNLWESMDAEKQRQMYAEKLEEEQRRLDAEIEKEETEKLKSGDASNMQNVLASINGTKNTNTTLNNKEDDTCFERLGVITTLKSNHGTIDHSIFFDIDSAGGLASDLKVGCHVKYLAFQQLHSDHIKVVQIKEVSELFWDDSLPTAEKIDEQIAELRNEKPTFFNTHQRNILGLIMERKPGAIVVDTEHKLMNINLDTVEIDFIPQAGDRVFICCNVQSDEHFVNRQGEVLQEVSVHPARLLKQEKCEVRRLNADWGVLNEDCYFTFDVVPNTCKLDVGDIVLADLIECERDPYIWRCIKLTLLERTVPQPTSPAATGPSTNGDRRPTPNARNESKHAITVSEDQRCVLASTFQSQKVEMVIKNNVERKLRVLSIEFLGRRRDSQVRLVDPDPNATAFELPGKSSRTLVFEVESKFYGESREVFVIKFETFRVKRSILLVVCETEAEAEAARAQPTHSITNSSSGGSHNLRQRSRHYANQVWSNKGEVIPGVGLATKRRFLAHRIAFYEVPERLRNTYLTASSRQEMMDNVESMFPCLKEELSIKNYAIRFQTLVYLEEIEYFVNFRNYDRERAHFTRDGEFLSLTIENLSERRPSLVIGDTVRAINPWSNEDDKRSYDGVIHKVLFNRVLLKFNEGFQSKYNGEDFRLEFYFSRFAFRKQHYAVNRIIKHVGEQFLFPSRVYTRDEPQLPIELDSDDNLMLKGTQCPWFNPELNPIQKRAIRNILRGESQNMPYVIFGPPGTGKTMTLVETMLQLIKHIPSSRLLIGTPSNGSADLIATRLIASKQLQPGDFVRLVSQNQIEKEMIPEHLMPYCATVDMAADGTCDDSMIVTESGMKLRCQMKYLGRHRLTISTCTTLGNFLQMGFPPGHFTHVLIDESGQCTEPEVMVPVCLVAQKRGQVILAGDPHQLQAIVINRFASEHGLSLSLLERILGRTPYLRDVMRFPDTSGFDPRLVTKLLYNYRSLPSILNVYSELFYDSELRAMVNEKDSREAEMLKKLDVLLPTSEKRPKSHGIFFYGTRSENKQESDSPSWFNPLEARNVFLMTIKLYRQGIEPENIGIITPYMKQVKHLRTLFIEADIAMPKIGSVEEFQGQERDIILISTVRSSQKLISSDLRHALGFVQSAKRMNVAISRARYLMFIFGNPHLLYLDHCWRTCIKYCVDNEAYLGCDLPDDFDTRPELDEQGEETIESATIATTTNEPALESALPA
ncbi:PREDICTED: probable RNA helicase armi [Rhagoletis zephyria]|uniref:probable RNA helicase armi n=1 Tax=Rhagoletis zephyria TaxID=28612 RepID=UPI0008119774|nr:PREDICTED: probable RNA helicase armi [Rhagoletis zephyria]